jgi:hypothetical protein
MSKKVTIEIFNVGEKLPNTYHKEYLFLRIQTQWKKGGWVKGKFCQQGVMAIALGASGYCGYKPAVDEGSGWKHDIEDYSHWCELPNLEEQPLENAVADDFNSSRA